MPEISPSMTLLQVIELWPETEKVLRQYEQKTGSCLLCSHLFDTLECVASQYNLKVDEILNNLKSKAITKG